MKLVIFNDLSEGGIADYAHDQATALAARGVDVTMLASPNFLATRTPTYLLMPVLKELRAGKLHGNRALRRIRLAAGLLRNKRTLANHIRREGAIEVLSHFSEYLAPLWSRSLQKLRRKGVHFHSVLHDPVRDYQLGPRWWHQWSVQQAFAPLSNVFVHTMERVPVPDSIPVTYIPYGVHAYPPPARSRSEVRLELGLGEATPLIVSYGYIRDNKNLDLVIEALGRVPDVHLLIAGPEQAGRNKPVAYYKAHAEQLGVAARCHWVNRFLDPIETADYLMASDLSVLTYSRSFVSSSAALGVTANYRLPCLISSGSTTTQRIVDRYGIGIWAAPDDVSAIEAGLLTWRDGGMAPDWDGYERDNGWARNAELVEARIRATRRDGEGVG